MADEGGISTYLSTRLNQPCSPIRYVVSLCGYYSVLPDLFTEPIVSKNPCLTPVVAGNCSPGKNKPQRSLGKGFNILYKWKRKMNNKSILILSAGVNGMVQVGLTALKIMGDY